MKVRLFNALKAMLIPQKQQLSPEVTAFILSWKFPARDLRRIQSLSRKANETVLTPEEEGELQMYCDLSNLIGIAQSKARQARRRAASAA